jgi:hypothetical protein
VVFVGGYGRSGSTIIDVLLNRVPGVVAVGEFRHLFGRALGDNELCSCGQPFRSCGYWSAVLAEAFPDGIDQKRVQRAVEHMNRVVMLPRLRFPRLMTQRMREDARIYSSAFSAAYMAVAKVSNAKVIVDSTKYPVHGWVLRTIPLLALGVILLVRDPRAVAFSWQRRRLRPEVHWEKREMPRYSIFRSGLAWNISNSLTARLRRHVGKYRVQRYEDFVDDPAGELSAIASFALDTPTTLPATLFKIQPHVPHTIAGNPVRIGSDTVQVRHDDEWRAMPLPKRLIVDIVCFAGMRRYRYPFRLKK